MVDLFSLRRYNPSVMLVIRLARGGRHKYPTYRIVAAESTRAATGKFVEILGHYNPHTKELAIKKDETVARLNNGAQPSNTVVKLLQQEKIEVPAWVKLKTKNSKPKKEPVVKEPKAEAQPAEVAAETETAPAVEAPEEAPAGTEAEAATSTPEEKPAAEETRVAEAATENAIAAEAKAPDPDTTETAEITEQAAEAAEATEDAGVETPAPDAEKTP
jgi:small subunit ribosomal protein S16